MQCDLGLRIRLQRLTEFTVPFLSFFWLALSLRTLSFGVSIWTVIRRLKF